MVLSRNICLGELRQGENRLVGSGGFPTENLNFRSPEMQFRGSQHATLGGKLEGLGEAV